MIRFDNFAALTQGGYSVALDQAQTQMASSDNCADIEIAINGDIYAAMGMPTLGSVYDTDGIYKSTDKGTSWIKMNHLHGLPQDTAGNYERIELACAPSDSHWVYALFHQPQGPKKHRCSGVFVTTDGGLNWHRQTSIPPAFSPMFSGEQAYYNLTCAVDPLEPERVFIGGKDIWVSMDTGRTWTQVSHSDTTGAVFPYVHADHVMSSCYDPYDPRFTWFGNDGGVYRTSKSDSFPYNHRQAIEFISKGYNVAQFYSCAMYPFKGSMGIIGGTQDNLAMRLSRSGIGPAIYLNNDPDDGGVTFIDSDEPHIQIYYGGFQVTYYVTNNYWLPPNTAIGVVVSPSYGLNPADYDEQQNTLFCAGRKYQFPYPSSEGYYLYATGIGLVGTAPQPQEDSIPDFGGGKVTAVRVSPNVADRVYFGIDNGRIVRVDSASKSNPISKIIHNGFSSNSRYVSCIEIEEGNEDHILFSYSNYGVASLWESLNGTDPGMPAWTDIEGNLPDMPVRWIIFAPGQPTQALIATEAGVWYTEDLNGPATTWHPSVHEMGYVRTAMLRVRKSDHAIAAATHGRGLFTTHYFSCIQQLQVPSGPPGPFII